MAVKFIREIVVSSLATALVTAVYTHGPDLKTIGALTSAAPAAPAVERDQGESLAQFQARIASAHVGKSSPPSAIVEKTPVANAASANAEPVWPPQDKGGAKSARASAKTAALKVAPPAPADASPIAQPVAIETVKVAPPPPVADVAESKPVVEAPAAQAEAASPSYAARIADKLKDYVWNPGAWVVGGVSSGVSTVTNKISSFVKKQPS